MLKLRNFTSQATAVTFQGREPIACMSLKIQDYKTQLSAFSLQLKIKELA